MSDSRYSCPGFESHSDHHLDLFLGSPEFNSSATLVNRKLLFLIYVWVPEVGNTADAPNPPLKG